MQLELRELKLLNQEHITQEETQTLELQEVKLLNQERFQFLEQTQTLELQEVKHHNQELTHLLQERNHQEQYLHQEALTSVAEEALEEALWAAEDHLAVEVVVEDNKKKFSKNLFVIQRQVFFKL